MQNQKLLEAAKRGNNEEILEALKNEANINTTDQDGHTPLHLAVSHGAKVDTIKLLLDRGANIEAKTTIAQCTPLHLAAEGGVKNKEIIEILLQYGANCFVKNAENKTPVEVARNKELDITELSEKKVKIKEPIYLILSVRSPTKIPLHKILHEIPSERLLLVVGAKIFSEKEQEEFSPFFNTIVRVQNYRDSGSLEMEVCKLYKKRPFQKVIAYHEYDLLRAARIRDFFHLEGQNYQSALAFRDKILMKNLLSKAGIKVPRSTRINSPFDILEFVQTYGLPAVIKPIFGTGADGVFILNNIEETEKFIGSYRGFNDCHLTDLEIESFIKGTTYHVDGFIQAGKITASWPSICINHCVDLKKGAYVAHHHLSPQNPMANRLNDYAKSVLQALPTPQNTAFLLEVFHEESKDEIIFCEIAARVGGGVKEMWPEAFGIDLEDEFIRMQAGLGPSTKLTGFLGVSNNFLTTLNAISGWIIFPKILDVLKSIPEAAPFPWVKQYIVRAQPKMLNLPTKNVSDSLASAFIVSDSENQFKERAVLLNSWLQHELQWEKVSISPMAVKCIEDCEESIKQLEKIDNARIKKIIKIQEESIEKRKTGYSCTSSTEMDGQSNFVLSSIVTQEDKKIEEELQSKTLSFFVGIQWKKYPESRLTGKYIGHHVRFFTMPANETIRASVFTEALQNLGFDAELKKAKDKPSVIVDLTTSKYNL